MFKQIISSKVVQVALGVLVLGVLVTGVVVAHMDFSPKEVYNPKREIAQLERKIEAQQRQIDELFDVNQQLVGVMQAMLTLK